MYKQFKFKTRNFPNFFSSSIMVNTTKAVVKQTQMEFIINVFIKFYSCIGDYYNTGEDSSIYFIHYHLEYIQLKIIMIYARMVSSILIDRHFEYFSVNHQQLITNNIIQQC